MTSPLLDPWWLSLSFWGEVARLAAQLGGALLIARLTVQWALKRYKAEKLWERETSALVDLLAAIGEIDEVTARWITDAASDHPTTKEHDQDQRERFRSGKRRLESIALAASIVLPSEMVATTDELLKALNARYTDWLEDLLETSAAMATARERLIEYGRRRMGTER